jgi:hypothetical protein
MTEKEAYDMFLEYMKYELLVNIYIHSVLSPIFLLKLTWFLMHVCCKTSLIRFFQHSFTNIDFTTLEAGFNCLAVPPKLKYDVCRKMLNTKM